VTFSATVQPILQLSFATTPPTTVTSGALFDPPFSIALRDLVGAPVIGRSITVTASAGMLSGATAVTTDQVGVALFRDLRISGNGKVALTFSTPGAAPLTASINVQPATPVGFKLTAANLFPKPLELDLITAQLVDASGNPVATSIPVQWSLDGPGSFKDQSQTTDASGKATANFILPAGVGGSTYVVVSAPKDPNVATAVIQLNQPPGLDLSLGSSVAAPRLQNGKQLKRELNGETRIGAETRQQRD
jgi:hypothetical protein